MSAIELTPRRAFVLHLGNCLVGAKLIERNDRPKEIVAALGDSHRLLQALIRNEVKGAHAAVSALHERLGYYGAEIPDGVKNAFAAIPAGASDAELYEPYFEALAAAVRGAKDLFEDS